MKNAATFPWTIAGVGLCVLLGLAPSGCATKLGAVQDYVAGVEKFRKRETDAAEKLWRSAFESFRNNRSWPESADVAANLGALYLTQHRYEEAMVYLDWAVKVRQRLGERALQAKGMLDISAAYRGLWKASDARQQAEEARRIFESLGDRKGQADALFQLAMVHYQVGELESASSCLEKAAELYRSARDEKGEILSLSRLVFVRDALGHGQGIGDVAEQVVSRANRLNDPTIQASSLMARGLLRRAAGEISGAETDFSAALRTFTEQGDHVGQAGVIQEIGTTRLGTGKPEEALKHYRDALRHFEAVKDFGGQARVSALIGNAHVYAGNYNTALQSYHQAVALKQTIGDRRGEAKVQLNIGLVYDFIGDRNKAVELYQKTLGLYRELGDKHGEAYALTKYGLALRDQHKFEEAQRIIEQSLAIHRSLKDVRGESFGLVNLGTILEGRDRYREAIDTYRQALPLKTSLGDRAGEARVYLNLGLSYNMLRDYDLARDHLLNAAKVAGRLNLPELLWQVQFALGAVEENRGDPRAAEASYNRAVDVIEDVRGRLVLGTFKADFLQGKVFVYEALIGLYHNQQRFDSALHFVERAKGRGFLDMLGNKRLSARKEADRAFRDKQVLLGQRIQSLSALVAQGSGEQLPLEQRGAGAIFRGRANSQGRVEELTRELESVRKEYREIQEQIQRASPELANMLTVNPLEAAQIRSLLDPDAALLEYYVARDHVYVFLVTREGVSGRKLKTSPRDLAGKVDRFRKEVIEAPLKSDGAKGFFDTGYRANLRDLYEDLITPFGSMIQQKQHLIIAPHGALHYLPFHALWDGNRYLVQTHSVSYAPSATVLKFAKEKHRGNSRSFLGVGNPSVPGMPPLPTARIEVEEAAKYFQNPKLLFGPDATEDAVKQLMPQYDVIHLATHGELIRKEPLLSNLRLSAPKEGGGTKTAHTSDAGPSPESLLTVDEIFDLTLQARLVVLSACESGLVEGYRGEQGPLPGDELVGLARAFIYAGTPTVIATLWKVADLSTGDLMVNFYRHFRQNPTAEALRMAQVDFLRGKVDMGKLLQARGVAGVVRSDEALLPGDHPYFWAPFVVIGDRR